MILLLDTTEDHCGRRLTDMLDAAGRKDYEYVDTTEKKISHCLGCNHCWLKTPGVCSIKAVSYTHLTLPTICSV